MKTNLTTLTAAFALATALPSAAHASSHMDAPLITRDPSANTTDVYAFVDQDNASAPDPANRGTPPPLPEIPCRCARRLPPRGTGSRAEYL